VNPLRRGLRSIEAGNHHHQATTAHLGLGDRAPSATGDSIGPLAGASRTLELSARGRRELVLFGAVYVIYLAGRWLSAGDLGIAREHARWVLRVERSLHIAIEGSPPAPA
jgi:hypothetical protein